MVRIVNFNLCPEAKPVEKHWTRFSQSDCIAYLVQRTSATNYHIDLKCFTLSSSRVLNICCMCWPWCSSDLPLSVGLWRVQACKRCSQALSVTPSPSPL